MTAISRTGRFIQARRAGRIWRNPALAGDPCGRSQSAESIRSGGLCLALRKVHFVEIRMPGWRRSPVASTAPSIEAAASAPDRSWRGPSSLGVENARSGCIGEMRRRGRQKREKTCKFMVNLREIAFKPAVFRLFCNHFTLVFTYTTCRLYLAAARR
jgi:hypothetical protein